MRPNVQLVIEAVARATNENVEDLLSKSRGPAILKARALIYHVTAVWFTTAIMSPQEVATSLGCDRTSVSHGRKAVSAALAKGDVWTTQAVDRAMLVLEREPRCVYPEAAQ